MRILKLFVFVFLISAVAVGCTKKTQDASIAGLGLEGEDKDVVTQTVTSPEAESPNAPQPAIPINVSPQTAPSAPPQAAVQEKAEPAPDLERNKQIQTALKNANLYIGDIDGKIGPLTRKAVEEFQKLHGLKVDGKVGPVTWKELQKYLTIAPVASEELSPKEKR